jgi:ubiquinone/menaquinone biosynthesis C-methylase UbiE
MKPDQAGVDKWSGVAPFWEKYREIIQGMFAPVTDALIEESGIAKGHTVLDVGTGPGEPALSVAALVGPQGKVVGIDPASQMVAAARRMAEQRALHHAQFEIASADSLPFLPESFDAVLCRFGAMFFPSPVDGVREMLRVVRPGRRVVLAVWGPSNRNPFFDTLSRAFDRYIDSSSREEDNQDAFRFAIPGKLLDVFAGAGAIETSERLFPFTIQGPVSAEEFWALRCEMSETLREKSAKLSVGQLAEVRRQALIDLAEYSTEGGLRLPAEVLIVSGTKNRPA